MNSFKALTANIQGWQTTGENAWQKRAPLLENILEKYKPNIIGFQEITLENITDIQSRNPHLDFYAPFEDSDAHDAIAWDKERFAVNKKGHFWFHSQGKEREKDWDAREPRSYVWVHFFDQVTNQNILYINTHLDHMGSVARIESTKLLIQYTHQFQDLPIILMGDFNATPYNKTNTYSTVPYTLLREAGFVDTWMEINKQFPPPTTFHDFKGDAYVPPGDLVWHLDWIFVKNFVVKNALLVKDAKPPVYPSDHYFVFTEIEFV